MSTHLVPIKSFVFYVHKPKAQMLATLFARGCRTQGYDCLITDTAGPHPDRIGVFYGVTSQTYAAFRYHMADGHAIYLDNGWLSTPEEPTYRFAWNGVQPFLRDLSAVQKIALPDLPNLARRPQFDLAMLILQSPEYYDNLKLGYTRQVWQRATTRLLESKGYRIETREKPHKKGYETDNFFDQMARAGIVVSLNSAATVKALRYGIPAYCTLDCTLSPFAPVKLPDVGKAAPPTKQDVTDLCKRLAHYELTKESLNSGDAANRFLEVRAPQRKGYWYGNL